jgi:hypothetical protein
MGVQKSKKSKKFFFLRNHQIKITKIAFISNSTKKIAKKTNFLVEAQTELKV